MASNPVPSPFYDEWQAEYQKRLKKSILTNSGAQSQKEVDEKLKECDSDPFAVKEHESLSHNADYEQGKNKL